MSFRPPPQPTDERARHTEELIRRRETDTARWAQESNLATQWDARAAMAAERIPAGASVLDVGAGAMTLGTLLKPGCTYQPADVVARNAQCFVADLNKREFAPGTYDWVTFLGVLEYVHDVPWALAQAHAAAPRMIATYCCHTGNAVPIRRGMGWVNDLDEAGFRALLGGAGWKVDDAAEVKRGNGNIQVMFTASRA